MADRALDSLLNQLNDQLASINGSAVVPSGTCAHCTKLIIGPLIEASGKRYHPEHFVCSSCNGALHGQEYYEPEGAIHCKDCYHKQLPICAKCGVKILTRAIVLSDIHKGWHPEHFSCATCDVLLEGQDFYTQNGKVYCAKDYHKAFASNCTGCKKQIQGELVTTANSLKYHPACFLCSSPGCVYCEPHYNLVSAVHCPCGKPIQGQYVSALGKKWHPDHFVCANCGKKLLGLEFSENGDRAYCTQCDAKLFP